MKKIFAICLAIASIFTLNACNNNKTSYELINKGITDSELSKEWLNDVFGLTVETRNGGSIVSGTPVGQKISAYSETEECVVVYAPLDVAGNLRLNIIETSNSIHGKSVNINVNYGTTYDMSADVALKIATIIGDDTTILFPEGIIDQHLNLWGTNYTFDEETKNKSLDKGSYLYTLYLPYYVEHFKIDNGVSKLVLQTYVLAPISYELEIKGEVSSYFQNIENTYPTIVFNVENGIIK